MIVWLWHALFDGTPLCRCPASRDSRAYRRAEDARQRAALREAEQRYTELRGRGRP